MIHENKLLSWHRGKPWLSLVEVHLDFGVQYFLSKAGGAKSSQKFQFCLCMSVYPCNQLQDLQPFVAYTNWLFIFCKKKYLQTKNVFLRKSQVFVSSARVTVVDHAWWWWWFVAFYENLKRNRVSVRTLFLYSKKQKLLKKRSMNGSRRFVGSNENVIITEEFQIVRTLDPLFVFLAQFNRSLFTRQFFQTQQKVHVRTSKGPKWTFKRPQKNLKNSPKFLSRKDFN